MWEYLYYKMVFLLLSKLFHHEEPTPGSLTLIPSYIPSDPDDSKTLNELVLSHGFQFEEHNVTTEDGYILTVHRILNVNSSKTNLKPVIIQHGVLSSSADFCINSPFLKSNSSNYGDNVAFSILLTEKYDVWLPNSRGNRYSLKHINFTSNDGEFWKFNLDDLALKDLPAVIEYILNETNYETIAYIGHSQGTSTMFELLSLKPEYGDIIQPFIALAPVVFMKDVYQLFGFTFLSSLYPVTLFKNDKFLPFPFDYSIEFWRKLCLSQFKYCYKIMSSSILDAPYINYTRVGVYTHFHPTTTSFKILANYIQRIKSGKFQQFDYDSKELNNEHYGQDEAPLIPLENISKNVKIALFTAIKDQLSTQNDVERLRLVLQKYQIPLIKDYIIPNIHYTHSDFLFGLNAGKYFIDEMIDVLDEYSINSYNETKAKSKQNNIIPIVKKLIKDLIVNVSMETN